MTLFLVSVNTFISFQSPIYSFEEVKIDTNFKNSPNGPFNMKGSNKIEDLPLNHVYESLYELKDIPKFNADKNKVPIKRNPFLTENSGMGENTSFFLNNIKVSGVITINDKLLTIVSSSFGIDTYEPGDDLGNGYVIQTIKTDPASVLISNNKYSRLFILED